VKYLKRRNRINIIPFKFDYRSDYSDIQNDNIKMVLLRTKNYCSARLQNGDNTNGCGVHIGLVRGRIGCNRTLLDDFPFVHLVCRIRRCDRTSDGRKTVRYRVILMAIWCDPQIQKGRKTEETNGTFIGFILVRIRICSKDEKLRRSMGRSSGLY
jgi:hypothetical protein